MSYETMRERLGYGERERGWEGDVAIETNG